MLIVAIKCFMLIICTVMYLPRFFYYGTTYIFYLRHFISENFFLIADIKVKAYNKLIN